MSDLSNPPDSQIAIPESLRRQLDDFRRHLWRVKIVEAVAAGFIGLFFSFLLVYGLDRFWQTPGWARLLILVGGVSLFAVFVPYWLHRWVWRQRREAQLARLIARKYPGLGDRLLGVIELQNQAGNSESLSPRLREAAMEAVAAETGKRELADALPVQRHRRWSIAAVGLAVVSTAVLVVTPQAALNALERWLMPFSSVERYTFTRLESPPVELAVPFGEPFTIKLQLSKNSEQNPASAVGRFGFQPPVYSQLKVETRSYQFSFPGQQDPGSVIFRIGDLRHEVRVIPSQRPSVESVAATVAPPAYLGIGEQKVEITGGGLSVVEGSEIRVHLNTNRPLDAATFGPSRSLGMESEGDESIEILPNEQSMVLSGSTASTESIAVGAVPFEIPFSWKDQLGISGDSGFRLRVDALKDVPPTCYLQGVDRQKAILPEETVEFEILAEDDFGLRFVGMEWSGQLTRAGNDPPAKGEIKLADGGNETEHLTQQASFSPAAFGIAPQKISLRGYTEDFFPGRGRVYSEPVTIYVLTRDEHAQMLKGRFDRVVTELEDLARREQELLDENQRLERLDGEELQKPENSAKLENQEEAEAESNRRIQDLTERTEELMKDAARNGDIDKDTLKKMAESLKSMQELSEQDLPKVQEKLGESTDATNAPEKAKEDLSEAIEAQKKALEKMKDAAENARDANQKFEAGTFVNRLKKAAEEQNGIATALIEAYDRLLGHKNSSLDPSDARRLDQTSGQQANTASDIRWLQEDLAHYFARTQSEPFKEILDEMRDSQIDGGLEEIRGLLAKNHSFIATEGSKKWADRLTEWAQKLQGANGSEQGGGDGGGGSSPEDEDFEFMLRVMKLIQQEQDIRAQTRALEQLRRGGNQSEEGAKP